jgi:glycosyltransferase involved in cell wall biosynthesis
MYKDHRIGVVVPAYNEEVLILETLLGIPAYVDSIFAVNDGSRDNTRNIIQSQQKIDNRITIIDHSTNKGLGQSITDGYLASLASPVDITVIMDGDNQMHPDDLPNLLDKIIEKDFDYAKGNRLLHHNIHTMPGYRFFGNAVLTILTKFATGYYSLMDPQCAYNAIRNDALRTLPIAAMTKGYGYNAEILCMLNIQGYKVTNVQVRPVYRSETSKIKLYKYIPKTSLILLKLFFQRLWQRYFILDFHPLVLFYLFAGLDFFLVILPLLVRFFVLYVQEGVAPQTTLIILVFATISMLQSILFAIWMDMDYNRPR